MAKKSDQIVRVYIDNKYWATGVLFPYFTDDQPDSDLPIFFRSDNWDFDTKCGCYVFRIPELASGSIREVYIPRNFVLGLAVKQGESSEENMRELGFVQPR